MRWISTAPSHAPIFLVSSQRNINLDKILAVDHRGLIVYIPDLTEIPNPNPYSYKHAFPEDKYFRILNDPARFGAQKVIAIGWLGEDVKNIGDVPELCIDRLFYFYKNDYIISDGTKGVHKCEICSGQEPWYKRNRPGPTIEWHGKEKGLYGHGHHLVLQEGIIYICPVLILHYILHHRYLPPEKFIDAAIQGEFISNDHYLKPLFQSMSWHYKLRLNIYKIQKNCLRIIHVLSKKRR